MDSHIHSVEGRVVGHPGSALRVGLLRVPYEDPDIFPAYVLTSDEAYDRNIPAEWAPAAWVINHMWPPEPT